MITEKDLQEAIAECKGQRNPNANTCIKLAAYYTILDHMHDDTQEGPQTYSFAPMPTTGDTVGYDGPSDFAQKIYGRDSTEMWALMDELMNTLSVLNPKLYAGVMRKIGD